MVVLPLGFGLVIGILLLNVYGRSSPRRRVIEGGLIALGASLARWPLPDRSAGFSSVPTAAAELTSPPSSLLSIVIVVAFSAGIAYGFVAVPAQTQLQEDLPEDVRGRVFGVLNMLVTVASFLPIIIVGPIADARRTRSRSIFVVAVGAALRGAGVAILHAHPIACRRTRVPRQTRMPSTRSLRRSALIHRARTRVTESSRAPDGPSDPTDRD